MSSDLARPGGPAVLHRPSLNQGSRAWLSSPLLSEHLLCASTAAWGIPFIPHTFKVPLPASYLNCNYLTSPCCEKPKPCGGAPEGMTSLGERGQEVLRPCPVSDEASLAQKQR